MQAFDTNGQFVASSLDIMELEPNHGTQTLRRHRITQDTDQNGLNREVTAKMIRDKSPESDKSMEWETPRREAKKAKKPAGKQPSESTIIASPNSVATAQKNEERTPRIQTGGQLGVHSGIGQWYHLHKRAITKRNFKKWLDQISTSNGSKIKEDGKRSPFFPGQTQTHWF